MQDVRETTAGLAFDVGGWSGPSLLLPEVGAAAPIADLRRPVARSWGDIAKRALDVAIAVAGLLVTAPVLLAIGLAIVIDSRGAPLFRQERVGRDGARFRLWKFRTMVPDAEERLADIAHLNGSNPLFKLTTDPRVTRVGRVLRRLSLDELPQLWNVVRGEMSLVGPRPALPHELEHWPDELFERLRVRPGLTGLWQVSGRSDTTFEDYVRLDLEYVRTASLARDVSIIAKTLPAVIRGSGAY